MLLRFAVCCLFFFLLRQRNTQSILTNLSFPLTSHPLHKLDPSCVLTHFNFFFFQEEAKRKSIRDHSCSSYSSIEGPDTLTFFEGDFHFESDDDDEVNAKEAKEAKEVKGGKDATPAAPTVAKGAKAGQDSQKHSRQTKLQTTPAQPAQAKSTKGTKRKRK